MEIVEIPFTHQGFDAVTFLMRAEDYRLINQFGWHGWLAIKDELEFENVKEEGRC